MLCSASKKKQLPPVNTDTDVTTGNEGESSLHAVMANMGAILKTLNTRIEDLEKKQDTHVDTATSHMLYTSRPEVSTSPAATSCLPAGQTPAELYAYPDVSEEVRAHVTQSLQRFSCSIPSKR